MEENPKIRKFPVFLKNRITGDMVAVISNEEWETIKKIGSKKIISHHKVQTYSDRVYIRDILKTDWEEISENDWLNEKLK